MVTNSSKIEDADKSLNDTAKHIYDGTQLGNEQCDNGVLIIYIKDKKQVHIIQKIKFVLLNEKIIKVQLICLSEINQLI